jgi:hypothetical protein
MGYLARLFSRDATWGFVVVLCVALRPDPSHRTRWLSKPTATFNTPGISVYVPPIIPIGSVIHDGYQMPAPTTDVGHALRNSLYLRIVYCLLPIVGSRSFRSVGEHRWPKD